jgi:putative oxidoreductase
MKPLVAQPIQRRDWMLRVVVGGAFVVAGALKVADPATFALAVANYRLLPPELINLVAILLPWVELSAGLFVLAGVWLREAALVITGLTAVFAVAILSALARGLNLECGCFGTLGGRQVGLVNLLIDSTLFLLAACLASRSGRRPPADVFRAAGAHISA